MEEAKNLPAQPSVPEFGFSSCFTTILFSTMGTPGLSSGGRWFLFAGFDPLPPLVGLPDRRRNRTAPPYQTTTKEARLSALSFLGVMDGWLLLLSVSVPSAPILPPPPSKAGCARGGCLLSVCLACNPRPPKNPGPPAKLPDGAFP